MPKLVTAKPEWPGERLVWPVRVRFLRSAFPSLRNGCFPFFAYLKSLDGQAMDLPRGRSSGKT